MSLKSLLLLSLLVISTLAGPSLHYPWLSNIVGIHMQSSSDGHPFNSVTHFAYNVSKINEVVDHLKEFHTTGFRFTTEELATHPEANAVVEFLREPLQGLMALGSSIDLTDCTDITDLLETCAVWSISTDTTLATARRFLQAINARVHRCVDALDKVKKQQHHLRQLRQRLVDGGMGYVIRALPLSDSTSKYEASIHDFSARVSSFQASALTASRKLRKWNNEKVEIDVPLANIHKSFVGVSQDVATAVAKCDVEFAEGLPVLLRDCQDERSRVYRLG